MHPVTRRSFLASSTVLGPAGVRPPLASAADTPRSRPPKREKPAAKRVAVVTTVYTYLSHAYHIAGRFLDGYLADGKQYFPEFGVASVYSEQKPAGDLSAELAKEHGFRLAPTVADALTLGTGKLAVDGVLLIGEHGDYPLNPKGQKLYPRYEYFQQIARVFEDAGRAVPVFCDKHLSYDRAKAAEMVATAKRLKMPLMAGSSLPVTWRRPELELPLGGKLTEAVVASRGDLETYGIHALEALQCMAERRSTRTRQKGPPAAADQGVKAVTCLQGDAVWAAGDDGRWSWELLEHALGRSPSRNAGDIRANCRRFPRPKDARNFVPGPIAFLVEYRDGLKAAVLQLDGHVADETFAGKLANRPKPSSCLFWLPPPPGAAFLEALTMRVEDFLATGEPPYPAERTQLTGGILDYALESRIKGGVRLDTPDLDIRYATPLHSGFVRGDYAQPVKGE